MGLQNDDGRELIEVSWSMTCCFGVGERERKQSEAAGKMS